MRIVAKGGEDSHDGKPRIGDAIGADMGLGLGLANTLEDSSRLGKGEVV